MNPIAGKTQIDAKALLFAELALATSRGMPVEKALVLAFRDIVATPGRLGKLDYLSKFLGVAGRRPQRRACALAMRLVSSIESGQSLSRAMRREGSFGRQECRIVEAGEECSRLPWALGRLSEHYRASLKLRRARRALLYPFFLGLYATNLVAFIFITILPKFVDIFAQLGGSMPALTQLMLDFAFTVTHSPWGALFYVAALAIFWKFDFIAPSLPFFGFRRAGRLERQSLWLSALSLGLEAGLSEGVALRQAGDAAGGAMRSSSAKAAADTEKGMPIGEACTRRRLLDRAYAYRLALLEGRPGLADNLKDLSDDASAAAAAQSNRAIRVFQIACVLLSGLILGTLVVGLYLPLFEIPRTIMSQE